MDRHCKSTEAPQITAIILTYNEEIHIERCLRSLQPFCKELLVVDSFSTDQTCEKASSMGAKVVKHAFENQARQFNWALDHVETVGQWVWRVDADEYISADLGQKVTAAIRTCDDDVNGIYVNKAIVFHGRKLKHGGWYPAQQIKVIRKGCGRSEDKVMDEHLIVTSGRTISIDGDQTDENLRGLTWWTEKHNEYASREAVNMLRMRYGISTGGSEVAPRLLGNNAERKRWLKLRYAKMPLFLRPGLYFLTRYVLELGFLDGRWGFVWHVLQGFWYRFLVDAKTLEIMQRYDFDKEKIVNWLKTQ